MADLICNWSELIANSINVREVSGLWKHSRRLFSAFRTPSSKERCAEFLSNAATTRGTIHWWRLEEPADCTRAIWPLLWRCAACFCRCSPEVFPLSESCGPMWCGIFLALFYSQCETHRRHAARRYNLCRSCAGKRKIFFTARVLPRTSDASNTDSTCAT